MAVQDVPDERILTGPKNSDRVTEKRTEKWTAADERILTGPKNSDRVTGPKNMDREKWLAEKWLRRHHHTPYTYCW